MKISEFRNEDALDLLADILDPTAKIFADRELANAVKGRANRIKCAKIAIKNHKSEIIEILARLDGEDPNTYDCGAVKILAKVIEILNDKELADFFTSQGQMMAQGSSTPATENIEAGEQ